MDNVIDSECNGTLLLGEAHHTNHSYNVLYETMDTVYVIDDEYDTDVYYFNQYEHLFGYVALKSQYESIRKNEDRMQYREKLCKMEAKREREREPVVLNKSYRSYSEPYKRYKSFKKQVYCSNCNGKGHVFKECKRPIKSYGIIGFRCNKDNEIQVCLIRRKNTVNYEAFIRGKFKMDELPVHLERMTNLEKEKIKSTSWDELYNELCYHRYSKHALKERKKAKQLYDTIDIGNVFNDTSSKWQVPEWEFPKGRKYYGETQTECALREFREETNIPVSCVRILNDNCHETFEGTNKKIYHNQYFISIIEDNAVEPYIDMGNPNQITEIGDVDWFTKEEALKLIRDYHGSKKHILEEAFRYVSRVLRPVL